VDESLLKDIVHIVVHHRDDGIANIDIRIIIFIIMTPYLQHTITHRSRIRSRRPPLWVDTMKTYATILPYCSC